MLKNIAYYLLFQLHSVDCIFQLCLMDLHSSNVCSVLLLNRLRICIIMIQNTNAFLMLINKCTVVHFFSFSQNMFMLPFNCVYLQQLLGMKLLLLLIETNHDEKCVSAQTLRHIFSQRLQGELQQSLTLTLVIGHVENVFVSFPLRKIQLLIKNASLITVRET